ncbi:MAG: GGDEF domain-containing protein, partial [Candidatus Cloacimonetes bacterium]|nr:GGDEF domain-containing protein [Candidatus Cloacimonadota bacterium]
QNGHLAGDHVLIQVARLIKHTIRTVDFVARYGGEEFIVLLSGASLIQGWRVAEKIRRRIQDEPFENEQSQPKGRLTISVGVAAFQPGMRKLSDLISRADKALYTAKNNGRNQVALFEESPDEFPEANAPAASDSDD